MFKVSIAASVLTARPHSDTGVENGPWNGIQGSETVRVFVCAYCSNAQQEIRLCYMFNRR